MVDIVYMMNVEDMEDVKGFKGPWKEGDLGIIEGVEDVEEMLNM